MAKITPKEDGALIIEGEVQLQKYGSGEPIENNKPRFALCRCGQSQNKPFCDGTHQNTNFTSDNKLAEETRNREFTYEGVTQDGAEVKIAYNPVLCGHVAECVLRLRDVFDPKERPWVRIENGDLAAIEDVVSACPSGALQIAKTGEDFHHLPTGVSAPTIQVKKNGPLVVSNVEIEEANEAIGADENEYILCRCGYSQNKPYCDGSHLARKWKG